MRALTLLALLLQATLAAGTAVAEDRVEVFTTEPDALSGHHALRAAGLQVVIYDLAAIDRIADRLGADLPTDRAAAESIAAQRFEAAGEEIRVTVSQTLAGLTRVQELGIDREPAVVFAGRGVVYGITDLAQALQFYREAPP